jgi:cytochrome b6
MLRFLRGGDEVTGATLTRFFGFHVAILPATATALIGLHVLLVQMHGMSVPPSIEKEKPKKMKFVPNFLLRDLIGWILAVGVLAALAAIFPWELGEKADAFAPAPIGIKPEWYFLFLFQSLKYLPATIGPIEGELLGILAFGLGGLFWVLVPFLNRTPGHSTRKKVFTIIGVFIVLFIIIMTIVGYLAT